MLWDTSKIDVIIRKIYKKNSFLNYAQKPMKDKFTISFDAKAKEIIECSTGEIETISIAN